MTKTIHEILRGDVFNANLGNQCGSVEKGIRPVLVIQNDEGNKRNRTLVVVPLSTQLKKMHIPVHEPLLKEDGMREDSVALCEQITTIDKTQLESFVCHVEDEPMQRITKAIRTSVGDDLIPKLPLAYTEEQYEMVMTLCFTHRQQYLYDPIYNIKRLDPFQDKDTCTLCNRSGYDYKITNIRAKRKFGQIGRINKSRS